jgi:hypothetical protein
MKEIVFHKITDEDTILDDDQIREKLQSAIRIKSNVTSARVYVNSIEVGFLNGNNHYLRLKPGFHRIELRLDKYETGVFEGVIAPDSTYELSILMDRKFATVQFNVQPKDAAVLLNGNLIGLGSFSVDIPKGRHEILIEKKGYKPQTGVVNLMTDTTSLQYTIEKITAKVELRSTPTDVRVTLNNEFLGETPLILDLNYGQYNLTFTKKDYLSNQVLVNIDNNEIKRFDVQMNRTPEFIAKHLTHQMRVKKVTGFLVTGTLAYGSYELYRFTARELEKLPNEDSDKQLYSIGKYGSLGLTGIFAISSIVNLVKTVTINKSKLYQQYQDGKLDIKLGSTQNSPINVRLAYQFN